MPIPKRFLLHIATENAAFEEDEAAEVARLLRRAAREIEEDGILQNLNMSLRDVNGNTVGGYVHKRGGLNFCQDKE